jgi:hypothetical protein
MVANTAHQAKNLPSNEAEIETTLIEQNIRMKISNQTPIQHQTTKKTARLANKPTVLKPFVEEIRILN